MNPYFDNKEKAVKTLRKNTNGRYKHFTHDIYHAGDIDQFEEIYKQEYSISPLEIPPENATETLSEGIPKLYHNINGQDVFNTFSYIYHKFKKGIFVSICQGKLQTFLPFTNANYTNEWGNSIKFDPQIFQGQNYNKNVNKWYANNYLIRYEYPVSENDTSIAQYKWLLEKMCDFPEFLGKIPDIEFFINKRDFPLLKENLTEPYNDIYGSDTPLISHVYQRYAPIFSPSIKNGFADLLFPTPDDISRIAQEGENPTFFRHDSRDYSFTPSELKWIDKIDIAIFRGSSTGRGCTIEDNTRLKLANMFKENSNKLNVGITKWNCRIKNICGTLKKIEPEKLPFKLVDPMDYSTQSKYRYIIHVQGHACAYRLSVELSLGVIILLVKGEYKMWYSDKLIEYTHYIPVKEDLSDLLTQIDWCRKRPKKCTKIVEACKKFYNENLRYYSVLKYTLDILINVKKYTGGYTYPKSPIKILLEKQGVINEKHKINTLVMGIPNKFQFQNIFPIYQGISLKNGKFIGNQGKIQYYEILIGESKYKCKAKQHDINELFIGEKCINNIIEKTPNFIYTFGIINGNNEKKIIQEYIQDITFFDYLRNTSSRGIPQKEKINLQTIIKILIALLSAIKVAQNSCCFVHNDLYPWNIVLYTVKTPITVQYNIFHKNVYNISYIQGEYIPVIIDYNKSGGIYKGINYNIIDPTKNNECQDPYNLIISTFNTLLINNRLEKWDYSIVYNIVYNTCKNIWDGKGNLKQFLNENCKYEKMLRKGDINPVKMIQILLSFTMEKGKRENGWFKITENYTFEKCIKVRDVSLDKISPPKNLLYFYYFYRELYKYSKNDNVKMEKGEFSNIEKWIKDRIYPQDFFEKFPEKYDYLSNPKNPPKKIYNIPKIYTLLIDTLNYKGKYELNINDRKLLENIYTSIDWENQYKSYRYNSLV
jgi:hypothetical protein